MALLTSTYGTSWLEGATASEKTKAMERAIEIHPKIEGFEPSAGKRLPSSQDVADVLAGLINQIPGLWKALQASANLSSGPAISADNDDSGAMPAVADVLLVVVVDPASFGRRPT